MAYTPTVAIAGLGSRGRHVYARYAEQNPGAMKITALADTSPGRLEEAAQVFGVGPGNCFASVGQLFAADKLADIAFICTKIKEIIDSAHIGETVTMQAAGNVGYYHPAHSFVRGNWRSSPQSAPMILAKC